MTLTQEQLDAAIDAINDDVCPACGDALELECSYDDLGWHGCKFCERGHVWSLQRDLINPAADMVADALEEYRS